jgi:hypothetical protein
MSDMITEDHSLTSLTHVRKLIKESSNEIFEQAVHNGFSTVSRETHVAVTVHYMNTGDGSKDSGTWEAGLVPKTVECDGTRITTGKMLLYRPDSKTVRGLNECILEKGVWERYPD